MCIYWPRVSLPSPLTDLCWFSNLAPQVVFKSFFSPFLSFSFPKKLDQNFLLEKKATCCWQRVSEPLNVPSIFVHVKMVFDTVRFQDQVFDKRQAGEVFSSLESRYSFFLLIRLPGSLLENKVSLRAFARLLPAVPKSPLVSCPQGCYITCTFCREVSSESVFPSATGP